MLCEHFKNITCARLSRQVERRTIVCYDLCCVSILKTHLREASATGGTKDNRLLGSMLCEHFKKACTKESIAGALSNRLLEI